MRAQRSVALKTVLAASILAGASGAASAQGLTISDLGLSEAQARALVSALSAPVTSPGIAFGSPVGFGMDWGEFGFGIGGQTLPDTSPDDVDGSASVSFGLGDATRYVGFEGTVNVISLKNSFGDDGAMGAKLHTTLPGRAAFAVGVENIGRWGAAKGGSSSVYAVGTKFFDLAPSNASNPMPLAINLGIGDNRFADIGDDGAGVFGGLAFMPIQQLSLIADWTGRQLNVGVSMAPFRSIPITATAGVFNATGRNLGTQFGDDAEFGGGIGYTVRF